MKNNSYRISIKALILDENKRFLLALEENGIWELLGGGLDYGESVLECLSRELKEESGLEVTHADFRPSYFVTAANDNGEWKANLIYKVKLNHFNFRPSEECVDLKFFTIKEALEVKLYPTVLEFVKIFNPSNH